MIEAKPAEPMGKADDPWFETPVTARWTAVPYQTIGVPIRVGLAAFHPNGIERVDFSVNGGPIVSVSREAVNPTTGEREYSTEVSPGPAGIEVRAVAYPRIAGVPRRFVGPIPVRSTSNFDDNSGEHSFFAFSGKDEPKTVRVQGQAEFSRALAAAEDGSRILITEPGLYNPHGAGLPAIRNMCWVSVEGAVPGVNIGGGGPDQRLLPNIARLRWTGVTFRPATFRYLNEGGRGETWLDGCVLADGLDVVKPGGLAFRGNLWCTNCHAVRCHYGFTTAELVRRCTADTVLDVFMRSGCVLSCEIQGMTISDEQMSAHHPDIYQSFGTMRNIFVRGVKTVKPIANAQALFINQPLRPGVMMKGALFSEISVLSSQGGKPPFSQMQGTLEDVAFVDITIAQQWLWRVNQTGVNANLNRRVLVDNVKSFNRPKGWSQRDVPPGVTVR